MRLPRAGAALALGSFSQIAAAHGSVRGLGNFFSGVVHPLFEPAQLLAILALGLLIGQRGLDKARPSASCFVAGAALGLVAAWNGGLPALDTALLAAAGLVGLAVLTAAPVPRQAMAAMAGAAGFAMGAGSDPESATGSARLAMLFGSGVGACVWLFNLVGLVQGMQRQWLKLGVRVAGSWIAASAMLVIALWIAGTSRVHDRTAAATEGLVMRPISGDPAPMASRSTDRPGPPGAWR